MCVCSHLGVDACVHMYVCGGERGWGGDRGAGLKRSIGSPPAGITAGDGLPDMGVQVAAWWRKRLALWWSFTCDGDAQEAERAGGG